mmetsp:Transcript_18082/g.40098  ORF Transcript_18082/g.40098 Transcript_18082/m.40098 type:complete len:178 (+) Transcript_18082:1073-1606(+)
MMAHVRIWDTGRSARAIWIPWQQAGGVRALQLITWSTSTGSTGCSVPLHPRSPHLDAAFTAARAAGGAAAASTSGNRQDTGNVEDVGNVGAVGDVGDVGDVEALLLFDPSSNGVALKSNLLLGNKRWRCMVRRALGSFKRGSYQLIYIAPGLMRAAERERSKTVEGTSDLSPLLEEL